MKKKFLFLILVLLIGSSACQKSSPAAHETTQNQAGALTVSAAISLKDAFNEIAALYKTKTGKTVNYNFGASGALQKQIETGAPVDVFASAGEQQMDELAAKNLIDAGTRRDFARNSLVLIVPADSKLALTSFADLSKTEVRKLAVGNAKTVPAGQYTVQVFEKMNLQSALESKLIPAEDVRQVLDYVAHGETDAGIVYATDARAAGDKVRVIATADETSHQPILYPLAVIKDSKQQPAAREFTDLVLSSEGQSILQKYGFR